MRQSFIIPIYQDFTNAFKSFEATFLPLKNIFKNRNISLLQIRRKSIDIFISPYGSDPKSFGFEAQIQDDQATF